MSAIGWITAARRSALATVSRRKRARKPNGRKLTPGLESLESIDLMSAGLARLSAVSALGAPVPTSAYTISSTIRATATQTTTFQTATVGDTLTNFTAPFNPSITLFDPNLGTLKAVHVTVQAGLTSRISSQNTSSSSPADITAFIDPTRSNYTVTGLNQPVGNTLGNTVGPVHVVTYNGTDPAFEGASTAIWSTPPPAYPSSVPVSQRFLSISVTSTQNLTLTTPAALAFYTASGSNTTITPQLVENGFAGASAPNGNLQTDVHTSGSGVITVSYDYEPRCPAVVKLVRFGIHHQPTQLQLTFDGPIIPASDASNPANYLVIVPNKSGSFTGPGVSYVVVKSAVYNPANNTVTLTTARQLNVHHLFQLQVNLPCNNGNIVTIQFGGKQSLGGFTNPHAGNVFVPVAKGKVVKAHK
jgi:hypothetical protein